MDKDKIKKIKPTKTQEEFREDILKITGDQKKSIDSFIEDVGEKMDGIMSTLEGISQSVKEQPIKQENEKHEHGVIWAIVIAPVKEIPKEDLDQKAREVADIVKPIMIQYDLASLSVQMKQR